MTELTRHDRLIHLVARLSVDFKQCSQLPAGVIVHYDYPCTLIARCVKWSLSPLMICASGQWTTIQTFQRYVTAGVPLRCRNVLVS